MVHIHKSYLNKNLILFSTNKFSDTRGFFSETYNKKELKKIGIKENFVQDNYSLSNNKGIIRGLHLQKYPMKQSKIIRVLKGSILDVVVDIRKNSKTFGKYYSFNLTDKNFLQLYISDGFAHGFCTLEKDTQVVYKASQFYSKKHEITIYWNDPELSIDWQLNRKKAIVSQKDKKGMTFRDFAKNLKK
tara:strand:+ start:71 stop:634 length:564 start_codon:yes stop_codon:yes gene_type:complete